MKPIVKIIIVVIVIFIMSLIAVKKSIDYTFEKAENTQTTTTMELNF